MIGLETVLAALLFQTKTIAPGVYTFQQLASLVSEEDFKLSASPELQNRAAAVSIRDRKPEQIRQILSDAFDLEVAPIEGREGEYLWQPHRDKEAAHKATLKRCLAAIEKELAKKADASRHALKLSPKELSDSVESIDIPSLLSEEAAASFYIDLKSLALPTHRLAHLCLTRRPPEISKLMRAPWIEANVSQETGSERALIDRLWTEWPNYTVVGYSDDLPRPGKGPVPQDMRVRLTYAWSPIDFTLTGIVHWSGGGYSETHSVNLIRFEPEWLLKEAFGDEYESAIARQRKATNETLKAYAENRRPSGRMPTNASFFLLQLARDTGTEIVMELFPQRETIWSDNYAKPRSLANMLTEPPYWSAATLDGVLAVRNLFAFLDREMAFPLDRFARLAAEDAGGSDFDPPIWHPFRRFLQGDGDDSLWALSGYYYSYPSWQWSGAKIVFPLIQAVGQAGLERCFRATLEAGVPTIEIPLSRFPPAIVAQVESGIVDFCARGGYYLYSQSMGSKPWTRSPDDWALKLGWTRIGDRNEYKFSALIAPATKEGPAGAIFNGWELGRWPMR
ncbi:MAG: hypothetical protein HUU60_02620 [Armatimonadetes bacterium]|nr:hypothetical protein [Armatimonadota bacterium]